MIPVLDQNILLYILLFISILSLCALFFAIRTELKLRRFMVGKNGKSLEGSLHNLKENYEETSRFQTEIETYLKSVESRLHKSIQGVGVVRFNPFAENSGNQSFATAFVDEDGSGVIFSSIYARERMSIFAKPISQFASEYELTTEEKDALSRAQKALTEKKHA